MNATSTTLKKGLITLCLTLLAVLPGRAVTLEQLRNDPKLTPARFAKYFADFEFEAHVEVQAPDVFLATQRGDCDDYATLAASILKEKGYTTRLIGIRLPNATHVVCYVEETKSYLDFNNRGFMIRTASCSNDVREIAKKVAKSFDDSWKWACEFTFENGQRHLVNTIMKDGSTPTLAAVR